MRARPSQGGREAVISSASPSLTPSPPPLPHQLNTTVALVNNAVQNGSVIKILTCNHPSENWVVTFLINCLYFSCPREVIQDSLGLWTLRCGFRISLDSGIPDSLSWITDSKVQDSGFHKQAFPTIRNLDHLR